jgi:lipoprotein-anchoring transpeptidase ErfK/SrfK
MTETKTALQAVRLVAILAFASADGFAQEATRRLIVSIPDRRMALLEDGRVVKVYPIAVGKQTTPSPTGSFHIASRVQSPTYYHAGKSVGPGPRNPVGTRWMGLGYEGYGIHGTNVPGSIGKAASHGCIRMRNRDVEELFELVRVGDPVELMTHVDPELAKVFAAGEPRPTASDQAAHAPVSLEGGVQ